MNLMINYITASDYTLSEHLGHYDLNAFDL